MAPYTNERRSDPLGWWKAFIAINVAVIASAITGAGAVLWSFNASIASHSEKLRTIAVHDMELSLRIAHLEKWREVHSEMGNRAIGRFETKFVETDRRLNVLTTDLRPLINHTHENRAFMDLMRGMQGNGK